ncbi:hypothetical protein GH722_19385 [Alphaproteobacteria bacterium HT1-32]|nr:hypothetical protein [Alphaproteobacteria bacterium HT1-32]
MKNNAFPAHYNGSQVIEWDYWERQPGCRFVFSLSLLKAGDRVSGKRWGYVTIERKKFHEWLKTIEPIRGIGIEEYSAEEKFATFLRKEVAAGPKKKTVHWYLDYALNEFGLGPRPARRIWEQTTPAAWRKGGRPKKP